LQSEGIKLVSDWNSAPLYIHKASVYACLCLLMVLRLLDHCTLRPTSDLQSSEAVNVGSARFVTRNESYNSALRNKFILILHFVYGMHLSAVVQMIQVSRNMSQLLV
jgi:hypothetical protein